MVSLHGLPRFGIGGIGSLGVFRENQDAIEVVCTHFGNCHSVTEIFEKFFSLDLATRLGVLGYGAVFITTMINITFLIRTYYMNIITQKAHAIAEANKTSLVHARPTGSKRYVKRVPNNRKQRPKP